MEPQKGARTTGGPGARPPGALSQTPNEEERREGGAEPAVAAPGAGAEAGGASADGLWELPVEPAQRRPECSRCR